jgi:exopolysaccharide production protein ExoQ
MSPVIASWLCAVLVAYLLVRDIRQNRVSHAMWIPLLWLLIIGSRLPSEWIGGGQLDMSSGAAYLDGSPLDRNIFLLLIVLAAVVLLKRSVRWSALIAANVAIALFFLFTFASIAWSDFPLTAFKRWPKVFGHVLMAMVVFTDREPTKAFAALLKRSAYVLLPVSVLVLKYYPAFSRGFDTWTGAAVNFGITTNKNALADLCLIAGLFFTAMIFVAPPGKRFVSGLDRYIGFIFLVMAGWLLVMAQSSTALVSTVLGAAAIIGFRMRVIRNHFSTLLITGCLLAAFFLAFTDVKEKFILALGEDVTLTGRTELWADLQSVTTNPLVGVGFESFWLGDRLERLWRKYWWKPNQAHNGYYEMYLNLGIVGLLLQFSMIVAGYRKARRRMLLEPQAADADVGRGLAEFRVAAILAIVAYNFTDATFKALHPSFFVFFLAALEYEPGELAATVPGRSTSWSSDSGRVPGRLAPSSRPAVDVPSRPLATTSV